MAKKGRKAIQKKNVALDILSIEYIPAAMLKPNPYNPNRQSEHEFELLTRSMREDGFTQPIIVAQLTEGHLADEKFATYNVGDVVIVDGEHRWRAGQALGHLEVPAVEVPMNVEQMRIATLRHNRARGSEDISLSAEVLRDLQSLGALDWAADSLMLGDEELNKLLNDVPAPEALASDEFSTAWEPTSGADDVTVDQDLVASPDRGVAATAEASDRLRERERRIAAAKTDEEREIARKETDVFRLVLVFANAEAKLVREVLGEQPAKRVLEFCRGQG